MTAVVLFAWLVYACARLWFECVDVRTESMGRGR